MKISKALLKKAKAAAAKVHDFSGERFRHYGKEYVVKFVDTGGYALYLDDGYAINMIHIIDF